MEHLIKHIYQCFVPAAIVVIVSCNSSTTSSRTDSLSTGNSITSDTAMVKRDLPVNDSGAVVTPPVTNDANVVVTDNDFISKNINDNIMEVKLSQLGAQKGTDARVKKAAAQMLTDHTQMLNDLKTLAARKNVTVPAANDLMTNATLSDATSKEFDQAWATQMLTMHEAKINELENVLSQTHDADIKALASKALPKIKIHRDMLAKITSTIGTAGGH